MDTQYFKSKLEQEKKELEERLNNIAVKDPDIAENYEAKYPNIGSHSDENAEEVEEYVKNISEEQQLEVDLVGVNNALERIEKGTYGKCVNCGEDIGEDRLKAFPAAENCIKCANNKVK